MFFIAFYCEDPIQIIEEINSTGNLKAPYRKSCQIHSTEVEMHSNLDATVN